MKDKTTSEGAFDLPYAMPNRRVEHVLLDTRGRRDVGEEPVEIHGERLELRIAPKRVPVFARHQLKIAARVHVDVVGTLIEQLDLATVVKVSQAVSSEIDLKKLLDTLICMIFRFANFRQQSFGFVGDDIPQRIMFAVGLVANQIRLSEVLGLDHDVAHVNSSNNIRQLFFQFAKLINSVK